MGAAPASGSNGATGGGSVNRKAILWAVLMGAGGLWLVWRVATGAMPAPWGLEGLGLWVAALLTLAVFSFLLGDNPVYKFAEHLFVGVSAAYWMVTNIWAVLVPNLFGKLFPEWISTHLLPGLRENGRAPETDWFYLVPAVFGILLLWRLSPKWPWMSRWALAFIIGITAGLRAIGFVASDFIGQIHGTIVSLAVWSDTGSFLPGASFNGLVTLVGVLAGLCYFYFSKEQTGLFGRVSRLGVWTLMITFGAGFGYTVMGRVALLVGRLQFLLIDWLRIASP